MKVCLLATQKQTDKLQVECGAAAAPFLNLLSAEAERLSCHLPGRLWNQAVEPGCGTAHRTVPLTQAVVCTCRNITSRPGLLEMSRTTRSGLVFCTLRGDQVILGSQIGFHANFRTC